MISRQVVLIDGVRTPFGKMGGALRSFYMTDLGALAIKGLAAKTGVLERTRIDCVFAGSALHDVHVVNPARYMALSAGLPDETSASFIEMQCGSAIDAINHAAWKISAGAADVIIAGGAESFSQAFAKFSMCVQPYRLIAPAPIINRVAPLDEENISMIEVSERMARIWEISRAECDEYALASQQRASSPAATDLLADSIVPAEITGSPKSPGYFHRQDEQLRPDSTLAALAALKPVIPGGVTTAGNASGQNDGAAFVLLMSEEKALELGYRPYARWLDGTDVGTRPSLMGIGPAYANLKLIARHGLKAGDIDVFECNEAFAAQNLAVKKEMENQLGEKISLSSWNPNGGAIALGHPNGASGARICIHAMKELRRRSGRYALISSCCGGGLGVAALIENLA